MEYLTTGISILSILRVSEVYFVLLSPVYLLFTILCNVELKRGSYGIFHIFVNVDEFVQ